MTDNRHAYFIRCISAISGIGPNPVFDSLDPLAAFLDDPSCTVLRAWVRENGTVLLSTLLTTEEAVASTTAYLQNVAFVKRLAVSLNANNLTSAVLPCVSVFE
jgi:hypothetical protein